MTVFGSGSRYITQGDQPKENPVKTLALLMPLLVAAVLVCAGNARAASINGTIDSTLAITEDSDLTGDVTCTVTGAPCMTINAPRITLRLNGYTMTGLADAQTGCNSIAGANEPGILVNSQMFVTIQGPGVVKQFRSHGIQLATSSGVSVAGVTTSTNCGSGILVGGGSDNQLVGNVSIRNGAGAAACGGI